MQRTLRKLKSKITDEEYKHFHSAGKCQGSYMVPQKCTNAP